MDILLHQFYKNAKDFPEKPVLRFKIKNFYHTLPWWLYKNKAKHFALGLIHRGFKPNDSFLICAPNCPEWVYTEMALLTIGMPSITCVERLEEENLLKLIEESKATGILIGWPSLLDRFAHIYTKIPSLKSIIATDEAIKTKYPELKLTTFREVFNEGIRIEDEHRSTYLNLRDSRKSTDTISHFYEIQKGVLKSKNFFSYQTIQNLIDQFHSQRIRLSGKQILSLSPLSNFYTRLIGLYLPIFDGGEASFLSEEENLLEALNYSKPHILFVSEVKQSLIFHEILRMLDQQNYLMKRIEDWRYLLTSNFISSVKKIIGRRLFRRRIQKILGGRIEQIIFEKENLPEEFKTLLSEAKIKIEFLGEVIIPKK